MDFSTKLFNMAVGLSKSIKKDSEKQDKNEIRIIREQKEGKRWGIVNDFLLLSLKTSKDYEKCEKVFDILDPGNQISFQINPRFERENLRIRYDISPMVFGERSTVLGQIVCSRDIKGKGWDIHFIRLKEVSHPESLDRYLPSIQKVISIKNQ